jgi:hypothetical protein
MQRVTKQYLAYCAITGKEIIILAGSYEEAKRVAKKDNLKIIGKVVQEI